MASFVTPQNGDDALAEHVAQITEDLSGLRNIPISLTGINDAAVYAQTIKNAGTGSKDCIMYAADGTTVLLQVDSTGVKASASGGPAAPVLTTTVGSITSAMIADGTIATADLANQAVTNAKLGSDAARANLLTNGSFEIWQRGPGPFTTGNTYPSDRWRISNVGTDTFSFTKTTANADVGSVAALECAFTLGTGAGGTNLQQRLSATDNYELRGRAVSFSMRVWANVANGVRIGISGDGTGAAAVNSGFHAGASGWATLTVTYTVPTDATFVVVYAQFHATGTFRLDNAMLVVGSVPADYAPLHPADDLARCLRYYEIVGSTPGEFLFNLYGTAGVSVQLYVPYKTYKAVAPTVTKNGTWLLANSSQPVSVGAGVSGFTVQTTATALGMATLSNNAANCNFTVEGNP